MEYPKWAPPELVALHRNEKRRWRAQLLGALVSRQRMRDVWTALALPKWKVAFKAHLANSDIHNVRSNKIKLPVGAEFLAIHIQQTHEIRKSQVLSLLRVCEDARQSFDGVPKWTRQEMRTHYEKLAKTANALASLIAEVPWKDHNLVKLGLLLSHDFTSAAHAMGADDDLTLFEFLRNFGNVGDLGRDPKTRFPELLRALAEHAKARAKRPLVVPQPGSSDADLRHFAVVLSEYFKSAYGTPLHGWVANVTAAVFNNDKIDNNRVRQLVSSRASPRTRKKAASVRQ